MVFRLDVGRHTNSNVGVEICDPLSSSLLRENFVELSRDRLRAAHF
jgi:hypothetical protein